MSAVAQPDAPAGFASREPVTESQRELWLAAALGPQVNVAFNEGQVWTLRGELDTAALERAVRALVARHASLRACFTGDGTSMCVHRALDVRLEPVSIEDEVDRAAALRAAERRLTGAPFDLERGPLFRFELLRAGPALHYLLFVAHHLVCDGWSYMLIDEELCALYNAARAGGAAPALDRPADDYAEYARRERGFLESPHARACLDYWKAQLRDPPEPLALPGDHPRPTRRSYEAARYDHCLPADVARPLRAFAASQNVSMVSALFGAFATLAHRLTGAEDLVLGVAAAGQALHRLPRLVGHCVHFLPLRLRPEGGLSVRDFLKQVRGTMLDAVENQGLTFATLLGHLRVARDPARPPLIAVALNCDVAKPAPRYDGLDVTIERIERQAENFELFVNVVDDGDALTMQCSYNTRLFAAGSIRARMQEFERLLRAFPHAADTRLSELALDDSPLETAPTTEAAALPHGTIHGRIAAQAAETPHAIAVEGETRRWTYAELLARADAIAAALAERGVGAGDFVGVCLRRTVELPAALLAVLKCGAAYLPLDPDLPAARLRFMFDDARARLLLCERATAGAFDAGPRLQLEDVPAFAGAHVDVVVDDCAPAYAIYTSGSTGTPKGVVAHHRGVINCLEGTHARIGISSRDTLLAIATCAFDASVLEFFLPLMFGARLVIATEEEAHDGALLARAIARHDVTRIFTAPAAWRMLLGAGWAGKHNMVGISWAEALPPELARALIGKLAALWNLYGPTEATVWMLGTEVRDADAPITIGTPLPNTYAYVLDAQRRKVPRGVVGELCIGGAGVALGYLDRPELTAERFVDDPFHGGRMYRTGDLARFTADGDVLCLGRTDLQVKLRGFRIELGEVEAALKEAGGVEECACGVRERAPGDARLVAWVKLSAEHGATASDLRQELRERLPAYMVPQHFRVLEALPRLPNGKLDRAGLPDPFAHTEDARPSAPRDATEERVAAIWRAVLGHDAIGVNDRLLDVGGHSLLALEVALKLRDEFGTKLLLRDVMTDTLGQLARTLGAIESRSVG